MDEKRLGKRLKEIWIEKPPVHPYAEILASWEQFHFQVFSLKENNPKLPIWGDKLNNKEKK